MSPKTVLKLAGSMVLSWLPCGSELQYVCGVVVSFVVIFVIVIMSNAWRVTQ